MMKKRPVFFKPKDGEFLMYTFVFSLMVMALLFAFSPYLPNYKSASAAEIEELSRQTKFVRADEVASYITGSRRPTMLIVYASWCSYCRKVMPGVYALWKENKISGDQMLAVALDEQLYQLAEYLLTNRFQKMLGVPIVLTADKKGALQLALQPLGSTYRGGIPYIGFFGPDGKMRAEIHGYVRKRDIENALVNLK